MNRRTVLYSELSNEQKENFKNMVVELTCHNGISRDNLIALIKDMSKEIIMLKEFRATDNVGNECLIENLEKENAELKTKLNPQTLYGIENNKVEKLLNVVVEYHFDREGSTMGGWIEADEIGKYVFLTKAEAEKVL
jgi:hypothetical protein